jgi:hypothetical protein
MFIEGSVGGLRDWAAIPSALVASVAVWLESIDQPTTFRE